MQLIKLKQDDCTEGHQDSRVLDILIFSLIISKFYKKRSCEVNYVLLKIKQVKPFTIDFTCSLNF